MSKQRMGLNSSHSPGLAPFGSAIGFVGMASLSSDLLVTRLDFDTHGMSYLERGRHRQQDHRLVVQLHTGAFDPFSNAHFSSMHCLLVQACRRSVFRGHSGSRNLSLSRLGCGNKVCCCRVPSGHLMHMQSQRRNHRSDRCWSIVDLQGPGS